MSRIQYRDADTGRSRLADLSTGTGWEELYRDTDPEEFVRAMERLASPGMLSERSGPYAECLRLLEIGDKPPSKLEREHASFAAFYSLQRSITYTQAIHRYPEYLPKHRDLRVTGNWRETSEEQWFVERLNRLDGNTEPEVPALQPDVVSHKPDKRRYVVRGEPAMLLCVIAAGSSTDARVSAGLVGIAACFLVAAYVFEWARSPRKLTSWKATRERLTELVATRPLSDQIEEQVKVWNIEQRHAHIADPEDRDEKVANDIWSMLQKPETDTADE